MAATVFVSGASGFIAQHVIKQLLEKGYTVVGSVRSESKGESLKKNFANDRLSYEIVEDLEIVGAFDNALKKHPDVTIFIHTASPVAFQANDFEKDIIIPAINGTVNVLQAINTSAPKVEKVLITSSIVTQLQIDDLSQTATEDTWSNITYDRAKESGYSAYFGSKSFAEKAGIEFVKTEEPNFTLSTNHPVYVFGPQVFELEAKGGLNLSNTFVSSLLELNSDSDSKVPNASGSFVDVRDVATAHIIQIEKPSNGLRVITSNEVFTSQKLLNIINKNFPELKLINGDTNPSAEETKSNVDDTKSREYLGLDYIGLEESVVDTVKQYLAANK